MTDDAFERDLERIFAAAPAFADADDFAAAVERRIEREARLRSLATTAAAVVGGVAALWGLAELAQPTQALVASAMTGVADVSGANLWLVAGLAVAVLSVLPVLSEA